MINTEKVPETPQTHKQAHLLSWSNQQIWVAREWCVELGRKSLKGGGSHKSFSRTRTTLYVRRIISCCNEGNGEMNWEVMKQQNELQVTQRLATWNETTTTTERNSGRKKELLCCYLFSIYFITIMINLFCLFVSFSTHCYLLPLYIPIYVYVYELIGE